jgi:uncharacterized protein YdaU (DUF1376 family)
LAVGGMTRGLPYFKCYPEDFLHGTHTMSHEDFANYVRLIFAMYDYGGPIPFDPERLRLPLGYLKTAVCEKRIRKLAALGKISIDQKGFIHNGRVDYELRNQSTISRQSADDRKILDRFSAKKAIKTTSRAHATRIQNLESKPSTLGDVTNAKKIIPNANATASAKGKPLSNGGLPPPPLEPKATGPPSYAGTPVEASPALLKSKLVKDTKPP